MEILNRCFQLRDCSNRTKFIFADQLQLFDLERRPGCLRYEIGTCLGPCVEGCSRTAYEQQVQSGLDFLHGQSGRVIEMLDGLMHTASRRNHFEHAILLREDLKTISWLARRLGDYERARREYNCIYPVAGCDGRDIWYLIRRGAIVQAAASPITSTDRKKVRREFLALSEIPRKDGDSDDGTIGVVDAWFRRNLQERARTFTVDSIPRLKCRA